MLCFLLHLERQNISLGHSNKLQTLLFDRGWEKKKKNNKISSTRSMFGSLQETDDVVRCKDKAMTILNQVQMSEDDRQREK